jgi:cell division septal protein FtsQ
MTLRRRLLLGGAALALSVVGWFAYLAIRDSSLVQVRHVAIEGLTTGDSPAIRRALRQTARRMTTLHVREEKLREAVDAFPVVQSISAEADFPNKLRITVNRHEPVAALMTKSGRKVAVAGEGILLPEVAVGRLPKIEVDDIPTSGKVGEGQALALAGLLARAPRELRPLLARAYVQKQEVRVAVRRGPVIRFGSLRAVAAKWAAATRVLGDPGSKGAELVDVRVPRRPAASGFGEEDEETAAAGGQASGAAVAGAPTTGAGLEDTDASSESAAGPEAAAGGAADQAPETPGAAPLEADGAPQSP